MFNPPAWSVLASLPMQHHGSSLHLCQICSSIHTASVDIAATASLHLLWNLVGRGVLVVERSDLRVQGSVHGRKTSYKLLLRLLAVFSVMSFLGAAGFMLPYPTANYAVEFVFVFLYLRVEPARLFLGACCCQHLVHPTPLLGQHGQ
jgi:hypothetical protein